MLMSNIHDHCDRLCNVPSLDTNRCTTQYCHLWALQLSRFCPWSRLTVLLGLALNGITDPKARPLYVEPWTFKSIEFYTWVPLGYHGLMVLMYRNVTLVTWLSPHIDRWLQLTNIDFFFFFQMTFWLRLLD